jgi:DNA-binding Lrp family transcriptional regulator
MTDQIHQLDDIDRHLLDLLVDDARRPVNDLADAASVSRASAYRRLARLREIGALRGHHAELDPAAVGWGLTALIIVDADQGTWHGLRDRLLELPGLEYLGMTTGRSDFVLRLRSPDMDTLRDTVLERLATIPAVRATETIFILDEVIRPTRPAPPPS